MLKPYLFLVAFCLILIASAGQAKVYEDPDFHFQTAMDYWRAGDIDGSIGPLQKALEGDPGNADGQAWMGEALRRQGNHEEALEHGRRALDLDPGHAMARALLGDLFNPQFAGDPAVQDQEESIRMYRASLASDPYDVPGLLGLCTWAIRQGDSETERACLRAMNDGGIWTESLIALDRWMLESAPPNAILVVNGDADSFPIWMLQDQGIRTDVLTCHRSLLSLADYRENRATAGLPLPAGTLQHSKSEAGEPLIISVQVIQNLLQLHRSGLLDRPLAIATTVHSSGLPKGTIGDCHLRGGVYVYDPEQRINEIDIQVTHPLMELVPPGVMSGDWTSQQDRSPVRWENSPHLRFNPMVVAVRAFAVAMQGENREMADSYRELYLAYREELGPSSYADGIFEEFEAIYQQR